MVKSINIYRNFNIKAEHKNSIVLIGNFDGLHLGHQKLFTLAKKYKKKYSLKVGVLTFEPMPKMYFNKNIKNFRISNRKQKIDLLNKLKVDFIILKKFDKNFSKTKSIDFIKRILKKKLGARFIFVSNNFRFGNKREGNVKLLKKYEQFLNYKVGWRNDSWELAYSVKNATDNNYVRLILIASGISGVNGMTMGAPETHSFSVKYNF